MAFAAVLAATLAAGATLAAARGADSEVQVGPAGSVSLMRRAARPHVAAPGSAGPTEAIAGLVEPLDEGGRAQASLLQGASAGGAQSAAGGGAVVATVSAHGANATGALLTGWHTESSLGNLLALNISDGALHGNEWGHGSTLALIGGNSAKFCADEGHMIKCNRNVVGKWEKFYVHSLGGSKWALKGGRHKKWCADEGSRIRCNRNRVGSWEKFTIGGSGTTRTLRGGRGNKLCADEEGRGIKCNRNAVGAWEKYEFVENV